MISVIYASGHPTKPVVHNIFNKHEQETVAKIEKGRTVEELVEHIIAVYKRDGYTTVIVEKAK